MLLRSHRWLLALLEDSFPAQDALNCDGPWVQMHGQLLRLSRTANTHIQRINLHTATCDMYTHLNIL